MHRSRLRGAAAAFVAGAALTGAACGGEPAAMGAQKVEPLEASAMPGELLGLQVAPEEIGGATEVKNPFVEAVGLFSLREGELLQGTLQVSRFSEDAKANTSRFRQSVVQQIGSTRPKAYRMGDQTVFLTSGKRQSIAVWFEDRHFYVLSTRDEFARPRALLRAALEIDA